MELYKDSIIGNLCKSSTEAFLLHIIQCWSTYEADEENKDIPMVLYCSGILYKYYLRL